ncbi:MAG TPA: EAL domain-containing protein [Xanthomonadaceae bacterium]|jgi:diguanylate cyclase (GGDEF)-like protein|nr:EAL domain-containing protein [Xanthomonadaceae bacterium]
MRKARTKTQASPDATTLFDLLSRLGDASTPREVAQVVVRLVRERTGSESLVAWGHDSHGDVQCEPIRALADTRLELARSALSQPQAVLVSDGPDAALRLRDASAAIVLPTAVAALAQQAFDCASEPLYVAARHLRRALELAVLEEEHERLARSERLQRALFAIADFASSDLDMPELLRGIHAIVGSLMYAENFFIALHDAGPDTLRFLYFVDVEDDDPPGNYGDMPMAAMEHSLTWYLLRDGKPLMGTTPQLQAQVSGPLQFVGTDSCDWLGVPMLRDGRVCGAIVVQSYDDAIGFTHEDRALLEFVASHILTAIERKRSKEELEQRVRSRTFELAHANRVLQLGMVERQHAERLQRALFQIAGLATADISQAEFYRQAHSAVGELMNARNLFIALVTEDGQSLDFVYSIDETGERYESRPMGYGLSEYVLRTGAAILSKDDILELARIGDIDLEDVGELSVCWLGVPLAVGDETIGLIVVQSYDSQIVYGPAEHELLTFVASQVANSLQRRRSVEALRASHAQLEQRVAERTRELSNEILEREKMQGQLKHEVMHDPLTGLPNRSYLLDRINRVLRRLKRDKSRRCALLYLDVDRFKVINDSLGHLAGDTVLKEFAHRMQACVREPDIVGRLSGDEFAILLEDVPIPAAAIKIAQRILDEIGKPLTVAGEVLEPSTSIGIAIGDANYQFADDLLRDADTAMYRAKKMGRRRWVMYDESLQENAVNVLAMEIKLRSALLLDQFEPHFQPIMRLATGETVGYEALLRWNHPTRGTIGPAEFMQIAQDNGSMEAIDWKMFEKTCKLAARLDPANRAYVAINVSPLHFRRADFDSRLIEMARRCRWPAKRLVIELTEGSLIDHPAEVRATLDRLRAAGIGAALDDFGTGHSSLSYLHTFPLRVLKIDRSFVAALDPDARNSSAKIVAAVIAMARTLEMEVVAEGIETVEQRDALVALGCDFGQGFLLGHPAPIAHWTSDRDN